MIFRIYHQQRGLHVHMRLFAGDFQYALGKCGDLVMREPEFVVFKHWLSPRVQFVEEIQPRNHQP